MEDENEEYDEIETLEPRYLIVDCMGELCQQQPLGAITVPATNDRVWSHLSSCLSSGFSRKSEGPGCWLL
jgi:hypothetical protein